METRLHSELAQSKALLVREISTRGPLGLRLWCIKLLCFALTFNSLVNDLLPFSPTVLCSLLPGSGKLSDEDFGDASTCPLFTWCLFADGQPPWACVWQRFLTFLYSFPLTTNACSKRELLGFLRCMPWKVYCKLVLYNKWEATK